MPVESVSAVLFYSAQPSRLADFYRNQLGIPFELDHHGSIREHLEADVGHVHLAVLKSGGAASEGGAVSPTFGVRALAPIVETLRAAGVNPLGPVLDLGEGKRVVSFRDPDGNVFNVIEIR